MSLGGGRRNVLSVPHWGLDNHAPLNQSLNGARVGGVQPPILGVAPGLADGFPENRDPEVAHVARGLFEKVIAVGVWHGGSVLGYGAG